MLKNFRIILLVISLNCLAQSYIINKDSSITIPLKDYKQIYIDYQICDSIITSFDSYIKNNKLILLKKDSIITINNLKIESYEKTIVFKDSIISNTNKLLTESLKLKSTVNNKTKLSFIGGFVLAILTVLTFK